MEILNQDLMLFNFRIQNIYNFRPKKCINLYRKEQCWKITLQQFVNASHILFHFEIGH